MADTPAIINNLSHFKKKAVSNSRDSLFYAVFSPTNSLPVLYQLPAWLLPESHQPITWV